LSSRPLWEKKRDGHILKIAGKKSLVKFPTFFSGAANHFWNIRQGYFIAGINPFRGKSQIKISAGLKAIFFKHRQQNFLSGAGIGGAFKNYKLAGAQMFFTSLAELIM